MTEKIKINKLEIENVKRIKAVKIEPTQTGLTVIGGRNNQGKTSVLDSIAWALGGNKYKPSSPQRYDSMIPPNLHIVLSDGTIVERKGKNSSLTVTDPDGKKSGQQLLDGFIEQLAIDLPRFIEATNKSKANILLQIIGVGEQLATYEKEETELYQERLAIGRIADQKEKYAKEQMEYSNVPGELISPQSLINQQQQILAINGENQHKREKVTQYEYQVSSLTDELVRLKQLVVAKETELNQATADLSIAKTDALDLLDQSTEALERNLADIEETNRKIRANLDKEKAEEDAKQYKEKYNALTTNIETIRAKKLDLLKGADLPLRGLSVEDGELTYNNKKWDSMSGSEQLRVATAIVRKINPKCGFVLLDKLEQMDADTLNEFGQWLEQEGLQAIATRVSTGSECSIIIEDGYAVEQEMLQPKTDPKWKPGEF